MIGLNLRWSLWGVLFGCVAGCAEVASLPVPPTDEGLLVTNWTDEPAFAWFPPFDGVGKTQDEVAMHWLVPDFDPQRVPDPRSVELSLTDGIPLHGKQA